MFFVLQMTNVAADAKNCVYPNRAEITSGDALKAAVPSWNHMKEKDGRAERPKFHVYFPIEETEDADYYAAVKRAIQKAFPFFDDNALDAARFIFGSDSDEVVWHEGWISIEEEATPDYEGTDDEDTPSSSGPITVGNRNQVL